MGREALPSSSRTWIDRSVFRTYSTDAEIIRLPHPSYRTPSSADRWSRGGSPCPFDAPSMASGLCRTPCAVRAASWGSSSASDPWRS